MYSTLTLKRHSEGGVHGKRGRRPHPARHPHPEGTAPRDQTLLRPDRHLGDGVRRIRARREAAEGERERSALGYALSAQATITTARPAASPVRRAPECGRAGGWGRSPGFHRGWRTRTRRCARRSASRRALLVRAFAHVRVALPHT